MKRKHLQMRLICLLSASLFDSIECVVVVDGWNIPLLATDDKSKRSRKMCQSGDVSERMREKEMQSD